MRGTLKAEKDSSAQSNPSAVLPVSVGKSVRGSSSGFGQGSEGAGSGEVEFTQVKRWYRMSADVSVFTGIKNGIVYQLH